MYVHLHMYVYSMYIPGRMTILRVYVCVCVHIYSVCNVNIIILADAGASSYHHARRPTWLRPRHGPQQPGLCVSPCVSLCRVLHIVCMVCANTRVSMYERVCMGGRICLWECGVFMCAW